MQVNNGFGHTFDSVTADYDRWRPDYPAALYRDLLALCPLNEASRALEIGIGTGQATRPILETGCAVTAVEPGAQLTQFVRAKFAEYPRFQAENARFEEFSASPGSFDLIYAATAFHWVDPEVGYPKVLALLKPGGVFARFANHPYNGENAAQFEAIQAVYARHRKGGKPPRRFAEADAQTLAALPEQYGFVQTSYRLYARTRSFTGEEYTGLLNTYSDNLAMEEASRQRFYAEIRAAIEQTGGIIEIHDTIDLELAVKPE